MRIIVNENVTGTVIGTLRQRGHDVISVKESMRGADDASILHRGLTVRGFTQEGTGWSNDGGILTPPATILDDPLDGPVHTNE